MTSYDAAIILGSKPDTKTWIFPSHVLSGLDCAADLLRSGKTKHIIVSGKWALSFDKQSIAQPYKECDEMASHLLKKGTPNNSIIRENKSKDTISNLFYIKRAILQPKKFTSVLFVAADFRIERLKYLAQKIFGSEYKVDFRSVSYLPSEVYPDEAITLARTKKFLANMPDGDEQFLDGAFYTAEYYS